MRKGLRHMLGLVLLAAIAGAVLTGCGFNTTYGNGGKFLSKADASEFTVEKSIVEPITEIDIVTGMGEVELIEADDYYVEIDYLYWEDQPEYTLEDGRLSFDDSRAFPNSYSINFNLHNKIRVYVPKGADLEEVIISTASGDVSLEGFIAEDLDVTVSYGDFTMKKAAAAEAKISLSSGSSKISDFQTTNLDFTNSYGNSYFDNINTPDKLISKTMVYEDIRITMSSGNVKINGMRAASVDINNSYGDITCEDLVAEELETDLSSGDLEVSNSSLKEIDTSNSYGDVTLSLIGPDTEYSMDLSTSYGSIRVGNKKYEEHYDNNGGSRKIRADLSSGDVKITFD